MNKYKLSVLLVAAALLDGCAVAAIDAAATINGAQSSKVVTTIDDATFTDSVKSAFHKAKRLGVVAGNDVSQKVGAVLESRGGYTVTIDRSSGDNDKLSSSERETALEAQCKSGKNDLALLGFVTSSEKNSSVASAIIGRAIESDSWTMLILPCRTKDKSSFSGVVKHDAGIYNGTDKADAINKIGDSVAQAILDKVGAHVAASGSPETTTTSTAVNVMTLTQAQSRLNDLGFPVGVADGVMGKKTQYQIKAFQKSRGIPQTGNLDDQTITELSKSA